MSEEDETEQVDNCDTHTVVVPISGFEPAIAYHWLLYGRLEDEWPDVVGKED